MGADNAVFIGSGQISSAAGTIKFLNVAATAALVSDSNANQINSVAKSSFSTLVATNHNYAGGGTPTWIGCCQTAGTAAAMGFGTIGATQYTPNGTANNCTVLSAQA